MIVNGSLPAGSFFISGGTKLGGNGIINCAVTLPSGATLAPGTSLGRLTVNSSVTLLAGSTTRIELNKAALTNDQLRVVGALTYGGTLEVTNLAGTLWAGDSFRIFDATSAGGVFTATNLPALPNGFHWQWTPANGTLSITSTVALSPASISTVLSGNTLVLSWPASHTGWSLQAQTNSPGLGLSTNWVDVPDSITTNELSFPIDRANGAVFFRMVFP